MICSLELVLLIVHHELLLLIREDLIHIETRLSHHRSIVDSIHLLISAAPLLFHASVSVQLSLEHLSAVVLIVATVRHGIIATLRESATAAVRVSALLLLLLSLCNSLESILLIREVSATTAAHVVRHSHASSGSVIREETRSVAHAHHHRLHAKLCFHHWILESLHVTAAHAHLIAVIIVVVVISVIALIPVIIATLALAASIIAVVIVHLRALASQSAASIRHPVQGINRALRQRRILELKERIPLALIRLIVLHQMECFDFAGRINK